MTDTTDFDAEDCCELCGRLGPSFPYKGRALCPDCTIMGCGNCWKARLWHQRTFFGRWWYICPACGWKGRAE